MQKALSRLRQYLNHKGSPVTASTSQLPNSPEPQPIPSARRRSVTSRPTINIPFKRAFNVSSASIEVVQGSTYVRTRPPSPETPGGALDDAPTPANRDPILATEAWINAQDSSEVFRPAVRRRRPGVVFDVGEEVGDDKGRAARALPDEMVESTQVHTERGTADVDGAHSSEEDTVDDALSIRSASRRIIWLPKGRTEVPEGYFSAFSTTWSKLSLPENLDAVLRLRREEAEGMMDKVQQVLDHPVVPRVDFAGDHTPETDFRLRVRHFLFRMSYVSGELPPSLFVSGVALVSKEPVALGGFSDIFRGIYQDQDVAVKRLRIVHSPAERAAANRSFCKEALIWRQLRHPHIHPFIGVDRETSPPFLCMVSPWAVNGNILTFLDGRSTLTVDIDVLILEVAEGLVYLHQNQLIHGDLRGANVLIDSEHHARLVDFGLSIVSNVTAGTITASGQGSTRWMAPELLAFSELDEDGDVLRTPASDIYAFGFICVEIYTLRPPYSHIRHNHHVLQHIVNGGRPERPSLEECRGRAMPHYLWETAVLCWSHESTDRPDMNAVIESLKLHTPELL